jgi:hypothetical protein
LYICIVIKTRTTEKLQDQLSMKNAKQMIVVALMAMTIAAGANASNEEKSKGSLINKALPANIPALEGPAPQRVNSSIESTQKTAIQKANLVELKLKSIAR